MNKNALIITYHVKNCKRVGGFHSFIHYLEKLSFNIDWFTCPVSLSWIFHNDDRVNIKNFFDLCKGLEFQENNITIRHFSTPVILPAQIAKYVKKDLYNHYWPEWNKIRKQLKKSYDVILVESTGCQYALDLRNAYPNAQIIYRPSDVLESILEITDATELEKKMIETADMTYCVDENQLRYYIKLGADRSKMKILRNPLTRQDDIRFLNEWKPKAQSIKSVVYVGVSGVDLELIEYAAMKNPNAQFIVIGPFRRKSYGNVQYIGSLMEEEFKSYLEWASVGIQPMRDSFKGKIQVGYTKKIIKYMNYLLPIVTTYSDNYLNVKGFMVADNKEEFAKLVEEALTYSLEDREGLREDYHRVLDLFLDKKCETQFKKAILEGIY